MATSSTDPILVRDSHLQHVVNGRRNLFDGDLDQQRQLNKDGLIDALFVLYDECSNDITKKDAPTVTFVEKYQPVVTKLRKLRVNAGDFEQKKVIGRGHFGEVHLVKEKHTGDVYAMKVMKKADTLDRQNIAFYEEEKDIMAKAKSEWITSLHCSFQDSNCLYLVMEFHPGGDLLSLLNRREGTLPEWDARFYIAELCLALKHLHSMGYVHRDVKPENVLLDRLGHVKLADFGSAAKLDTSGLVWSKMAVGTADYIAPEVLDAMNKTGLESGGYGVECDFWSLGVLAYEMVFGKTPFGADKMSAVYGNIMKHRETLKFPPVSEGVGSPEFRSLVSGLLCDAKNRLDYKQLVRHDFFAAIDWNGLRACKPPNVPIVSGLDDTSNFDEIEEQPSGAKGLLRHATPSLKSGHVNGFSRDLPFIGFTYVKDAMQGEGTSTDNGHRLKELEAELKAKSAEVAELRQQKLAYEQERAKQWSVDLLGQKVQRLERERSELEQKLSRAKKDADRQRTKAEQEAQARLEEQKTVSAMVKEITRNCEVIAEKDKDVLKQEVQIWKEAVEIEKRRAGESIAVLKQELETATDAAVREMERADRYKAQVIRLKEMSARGQRVEEKRASILPTNMIHKDELLSVQHELEKERSLKAQLKEQVRKLEGDLRQSKTHFEQRLTDEQNRWTSDAMAREDEFRGRIDELEGKILREKEIRIQELEARLQLQLAECVSYRERAEQLQKSLDETAQWRNSFESSFSVRESEMEQRIRQLESDLRAASNSKLDLQRQVAEATAREAIHLQKYEGIVVDMKQAVEKLERRNNELEERLSSFEANSIASSTCATSPAHDDEHLKQKIVFLEEQVGKLEQQLEKSRESLTLEREKARTTQSELWRKEKELSDTKIDLRIANRETKTSEAEVAKLKEAAKRFDGQLKAKDEEIESVKSELTKLKAELDEARRSLSEKERACIETTKDLEAANQLAGTARELRREAQRWKDELAICQRLKGSVESELQRAEERLSRYNEEKAECQGKLEAEAAKRKEAESNMTILKDTMTMMDEQLQDFEKMVQEADGKQAEWDKEKAALAAQLDQLKQDLQASKQASNEEKSLKLFTESKLRDLESRLKTVNTEADARTAALEREAGQSAAELARLREQVTDLDQQLSDAEMSITSLAQHVADLEKENTQLQEESTALRTQLISLKHSNNQLSEGLDEAIRKAENFKERIVQLDSALETAKAMHKEREHKLESTIGQQTKLIDFLQSKTEQAGKKKPTLADKIFGSAKKENYPGGSAAAKPSAQHEMEINLEKKTAQIQSLKEQVNKLKAELAAATAATRAEPPSTPAGTKGYSAITPLPHRAISRLLQSPGTQQSSPSSNESSGQVLPAGQRMHHNIPHRLQSQMVMRATNCAVCLDSVHFGRQVAVCQECGATAHPKCSAHLPSTCGLPVGLAQHFVLDQNSSNKTATATTPAAGSASLPDPKTMQGYVKIPRPGKAGCWDRKFMKLKGTKLCVYDHEPTSELMEPIDTFELCPTDGSGTVAVHSAVSQSEVTTTAKTDVPYIFMVESVPATTCWPGRSLYIMALTFPDKKAWVEALQSVTGKTGGSSAGRGLPPSSSSSQLPRDTLKTILRLDDPPLDVNCLATIQPGVLLIGAKEGLFSYHLNRSQGSSARRPEVVRIDGVTDVHQITIVRQLSAVLMIVGTDRQLVMTSLRVLQGCADAIQCADPSIEVSPVSGCDDCHLFDVSSSDQAEHQDPKQHGPVFLCAATQNRVKLLKWAGQADGTGSFTLRKELIVSETCSCIRFTRHSVLVGCDRFYEVDLSNFSAEEFLDASDSSLAYVVFGLKQNHSFPVAILDVTSTSQRNSGESEFLLCYHEFGIFVDGYGRRSRSADVKWTRLPLAFAYRRPYLFVVHFNTVEVMRLTSQSFQSSGSNKAGGVDDSLTSDSSSASNPPDGVFIELPGPRFLGPAPECGSNYYLSQDAKSAEIVMIDANRFLSPTAESDSSSRREDDDVSVSGSEFSITPSVARILDEADGDSSSITSDSSAMQPHKTSSPQKRMMPGASGAAGSSSMANSKRVKFESDL